MNGYFQLEVQSEGVFVKIYPPTEGGEAVNIKELMDYLEMRQLNHYDLKDLIQQSITRSREDVFLLLVLWKWQFMKSW